MWTRFVWPHTKNPFEHESGPSSDIKDTKFTDYLNDSQLHKKRSVS